MFENNSEMSNFDNQLSRMKSLITYGQVNESSKKDNAGSLEYHKEGADGKVYGIIRECHNFYIKTTTPEKAEIVESYDYIGGWNNHKDYEYKDYRTAEKQLAFKLQSINEAYGAANEEVHEDNNVIMTESTQAMKDELARQREIMRNVNKIITEGSYVGVGIGNPERVKGNSNPSTPFVDTAKAELDKDMTKSESKPENAAEPFEDKAKAELDKDLKKTESEPENAAEPFEKKVVKEGAEKNCEGEECNECGLVKEDEDEFTEDDFQVDDDSNGEEIEIDAEKADEEPAEEPAEEEIVDDEETDEPEDEDVEGYLDDLQADIDALRAALKGEEEPEEIENSEVETDDETEVETDVEDEVKPEEEIDDDDDDLYGDMDESAKKALKPMVEAVMNIVKSKLNEEKTVLHDFGKHPGYRKKPMSLPPAEGENEPFGTKIGDTAPFDKAVDMITDAIMFRLKKKI